MRNGEAKKNLYLIGGPMGVGKTAVCQELKVKLDRSVFLDGDWCWDTNPFIVTDKTKSMVMSIIVCMLNNFIACPDIDDVVFCWVMHEQEIIESILTNINLENCNTHVVTLIADKEVLKARLGKDIAEGKRQSDIVERSLNRLASCEKLRTKKIDTTQRANYRWTK